MMVEDQEYPVTVAVFFKCRYDPATNSFLQAFEGMVSWWLEKMAVFEGKSQQELRAKHYDEARARWGEWNSQHVETSGGLAFFIHTHKVKKVLKITVLSPLVSSIVDGKLRISLNPRLQFGYVELFVDNNQQKALLKMAENGLCRLGQAVMFEGGVLIPFILGLNLGREKAWQVTELLEKPKTAKEN